MLGRRIYLLLLILATPLQADDALERQAVDTMVKAARYFRHYVATNGGYLWAYQSDLSRRQGENIASPSTIWVQPPGTPAVGMALLAAYEATGDGFFLNGAVDAARALVWGQLASGGWDYRIDFDAARSKRWHYRRDLDRGDVTTGQRRNRTTLDDNNTQSALQLLMRVDKALDFADAAIHNAAQFGLEALLKAQYPNGAWPQRYDRFPAADQFPVNKARYPATWSRRYLRQSYGIYYTFNDNTIADAIKTMLAAHRVYRDQRFLEAAKRGGDFIILAQMPEPQPAWAQQYNLDMEPAWARKFEPPAIVSAESFGIMQTLLELYSEVGEARFLEPIPRALAWFKKVQLPDDRLARFYELKTDRPLYFTREYVLTYDDSDMPTHYAFKVGNRTESIERKYNDLVAARRSLPADRDGAPSAVEEARVKAIIAALDSEGRWVEAGRLKDAQNPRQTVDAQMLSCRTFNRNMTLLARYLRAAKGRQ